MTLLGRLATPLLLALLAVPQSAQALVPPGGLADAPVGPPGSWGLQSPAAATGIAATRAGADITPVALAAAPGDQKLEFICAKPGDGSMGFHRGSANALYTCPIRVYDFVAGSALSSLGAFSPFGNIRLAVKESDPTHASFFSLHGPPAGTGPTNRSRADNTHTTFTTTDMGLSWVDSWTPGCPEEGGMGEAAAGTMDASGRVTQAYLWSHGHEGSALHTWILGPGEEAESYITLYCEGDDLRIASDDGTRIDALYLSNVLGDAPDADNGTVERQVLTWHQAPAGVADDAGTIAFAATKPERADGNGTEAWDFFGNATIHGCFAASDTVAWDGRLFVTCVAGPGYTGRTAYRAGDIDLWSFDPATGESRFLSHTGLRWGHPRLAVTPDGYFAAASSRRLGEQAVEAPVAFGWHGRSWEAARDLGPSLHQLLDGRPLRSAHVTALAFAAQTKTLFAVYKEWNHVQDDLPASLGQVDADEPPRLTDHKKVVFTLDACTAPIAASELVLGTSPDAFQQPPEDSHIYDDLEDGLQSVRMPTGEDWVFFAINDYGAAQFGAIRGGSGANPSVCVIPPPLPAPPAPIIPQALSTSTGAVSAVGAVAGVAALAAITYLLTVKRRVPIATVAEDR